MHADEILEAYKDVAPKLAAAGKRLTDEISAWLAVGGEPKVHSVTYRTKNPGSLRDKWVRPDRNYKNLWDVTDLLGVRIITYFEDDVDRVGRLIEQRMSIRFEHSKDRRRQGDNKAFGYRSLHYVCGFPLAEGALPQTARFEVQVRTVLEHAWAEIEHDLGYKTKEAIPAASRRRLHRLAGLLELADQEFVAVRRELDAYAKSLPLRMGSEVEDDVPLDLLSLPHLLDCPEVYPIDCAIAEQLGSSVGTMPFYPDYLLRMLSASGLRTVKEVQSAVQIHKQAILALVRPYFRFAERTWNLSPFSEPRQLLRGYSLFFLAHTIALGEADLDVNRVGRLALLYQTLDYPDDPQTASEVASHLVEAFRSATMVYEQT